MMCWLQKESVLLEKTAPLVRRILEDELLTAAFEIEVEEEKKDFVLQPHEVDGLKYILDFIVKKFKGKYSFLVTTDHVEDWIAAKDRGGLNRMHSDIMKEFLATEKIFRDRHSNSLVEESSAVSKLLCLAKDSGITVSQDIIEYLFRCRIYFKLRILNSEL